MGRKRQLKTSHDCLFCAYTLCGAMFYRLISIWGLMKNWDSLEDPTDQLAALELQRFSQRITLLHAIF